MQIKTKETRSVVDVEKSELLYSFAGNANGAATTENSMEVPQKTKYRATL